MSATRIILPPHRYLPGHSKPRRSRTWLSFLRLTALGAGLMLSGRLRLPVVPEPEMTVWERLRDSGAWSTAPVTVATPVTDDTIELTAVREVRPCRLVIEFRAWCAAEGLVW